MSHSPVNFQPAAYHTVTPYLIVKGCAEALEFYKRALGATELYRIPGPDGKIGHAEFRIGDTTLMMADEFPERDCLSPLTLGGTPFGLCVYVPDVDATFAQALAAGARSVMAVKTQFYGDRSGSIIDPFGHKWTIATHVEDVSPEELNRRSEAAMKELSTSA